MSNLPLRLSLCAASVILVVLSLPIALALESNSIQMGRFTVASGVDARLSGGNITVIGSFYDYYHFQIFGKSTLQSPADLKGKTIAASTAGSASDYGVMTALFGTQK